MAFDFPTSPSVGQASNGYVWDGEKWTRSGGPSIFVSDTPPVSPPDNSLWFESDTGITYIRFRDADSVQWISVASGANAAAVRYDVAQTLTPVQQTQARKNIFAAPIDLLAYSGLQYNGSFEISQELGSGVGFGMVAGANAKYLVDGWVAAKVGAMVTYSGHYRAAGASYGLQGQIYIGVTTPLSTLAANDYVMFIHYIEGYRAARLNWGTANAQPLTIAFWSAHTRVGTYSVGITGTSTRTYVASYTQNVSNAFEYKVITIPGDTSATVWAGDAQASIAVNFIMAAGSALIGPAPNVWSNGSSIAVPGQVNAVAATTDNMRLFGVMMIPGSEAPTIERHPFILRTVDQETPICQRYWERLTGGYRGYMGPAGLYGTGHQYRAVKRIAPTLVLLPPPSYSNSTLLNGSLGGDTYGCSMQWQGTAGADSYNLTYSITADARM